MDCAKEPLNGAVFLSRMKTRVFYKAFVCGVRIDSHHHAALFSSPFFPLLASGKDFIMYFDQKVFGERLQQLRVSSGMTQEVLAEKANTERSHIAKIEKGSRSCSIDLLIVFSGIFSVSTDYLLFGRSGNEALKNDLALAVEQLAMLVRKL